MDERRRLRSLLAKLENAAKSREKGNNAAACGQLAAFINELNAQSGKKLTAAQASELTTLALTVLASFGC